MTDDHAGKVADAVLVAAALTAAWYVLRTPKLRRIAWSLAVTALTGALPAWIGQEVQRAWVESGRHAI